MNILLVDDERDVLISLSRFLRKLGYRVECASDGFEGINKSHINDYDLIITDIRMPKMDGVELLRRIKGIEHSATDVIIITGHGDMDNAVKSLKYGAYDYFQKPINIRELASTIERCAEDKGLAKFHRHLPEVNSENLSGVEPGCLKTSTTLSPPSESSLEKLGVYSDVMRNIFNLAQKYSQDRSISILIEGETGTGKELVARYIHYNCNESAARPFVAISCPAFPETLFEVELFGHEKGAYTGATTSGQKGKLEIAQGGTVFLDEIGELPLSQQVKLLRVLEEKKFFRVGGIKEVGIDVRIIAATNKDLNEEVRAGRFRADLFYRISVARVTIPPLRERKDAILPLAIKFLKRSASRKGKTFGGFTPAAQNLLIHHPWPGNVRQLENAMKNLAIRCFGPLVDLDDLSFLEAIRETNSFHATPKPVLGGNGFELPPECLKLDQLNQTIIRQALDKHSGNVTRTAQYLSISRRVLQGRLKKFGFS